MICIALPADSWIYIGTSTFSKRVQRKLSNFLYSPDGLVGWTFTSSWRCAFSELKHNSSMVKQNTFLHLTYRTGRVSLIEMRVAHFVIFCFPASACYPKHQDFANFATLFSACAWMHAVRGFIKGPDHQTLKSIMLSCLLSYITQRFQNLMKHLVFTVALWDSSLSTNALRQQIF